MKKYNRIFPGMAFFLIMYAIAVLGIVQEDRTYSSSENRMLQTLPRISKKRVLKGKFQKKYETYLSDQFPARDSWIKVKSAAERLAGKTESNNVYFGKHHYLLEKYTQKDFDKKQGKKNIQALKEFAEKLLQGEEKDSMVNVKVMMVPSKTDILKKELPAFAESYDETIFYEKLEKELPKGVLVPVKEALEKHAKEYIYYRNDHHWTTLGAWYGYEAYLQACDDLGMERLGTEWEDNVKTEENLKEQEEVQETVDKKENIILKKKRALKSVSKNFLGTTYSKVNMYSEMDEIFIYEPEGEFSVIYNLGEKTTDSFYEWEYLEKKDQYSVFSGGNQGVLEITRGKEVEKKSSSASSEPQVSQTATDLPHSTENSKTLLVVKDSFANCMIPFLMEDYERIVVVDMRQLNVGLSMVMRMYKPDDVLVLYNLVQFMQDRDFAAKP